MINSSSKPFHIISVNYLDLSSSIATHKFQAQSKFLIKTVVSKTWDSSSLKARYSKSVVEQLFIISMRVKLWFGIRKINPCIFSFLFIYLLTILKSHRKICREIFIWFLNVYSSLFINNSDDCTVSGDVQDL